MTQSNLGRQAEDYALAYLLRQGLKLMARNYRCRFGEIDLILVDGKTLVFAEVRCRTSSRFGSAEESINAGKQRRLIQAAQHYLTYHVWQAPMRFDVLTLIPTAQGFDVTWIRDAFSSDC